MVTVAEAAHAIVMNTPVLTEGLARGVLNLSEVARQIRGEVERRTGREATISAIAMALGRMPIASSVADASSFVPDGADMIVRPGLFEITYAASPTLFRGQRRLLELGAATQAFWTMTSGVEETTVIAVKSLKPVIEMMFENEQVLYEVEDLSSITIRLPASILATPGAYAQLLKLLAWEGINIVEVVSTYRELTILLRREEVDRAFAVLQRTGS